MATACSPAGGARRCFKRPLARAEILSAPSSFLPTVPIPPSCRLAAQIAAHRLFELARPGCPAAGETVARVGQHIGYASETRTVTRGRRGANCVSDCANARQLGGCAAAAAAPIRPHTRSADSSLNVSLLLQGSRPRRWQRRGGGSRQRQRQRGARDRRRHRRRSAAPHAAPEAEAQARHVARALPRCPEGDRRGGGSGAGDRGAASARY